MIVVCWSVCLSEVTKVNDPLNGLLNVCVVWKQEKGLQVPMMEGLKEYRNKSTKTMIQWWKDEMIKGEEITG